MIRFDPLFEDESCDLGRRYMEDNEGMDLDAFMEKYASPELKEYCKKLEDAYAEVRAEGCR